MVKAQTSKYHFPQRWVEKVSVCAISTSHFECDFVQALLKSGKSR